MLEGGSGLLQQQPVSAFSIGVQAHPTGAQPGAALACDRSTALTGNATAGVNWPSRARTAIASRIVATRARNKTRTPENATKRD